MGKDSFISKIIHWLEKQGALQEQPNPPQNTNAEQKPNIPPPIVKKVYKDMTERDYEEELKDFPDFNEQEFFVEVQEILWQQIREQSSNKTIRFYSLEVGLIIDCPKCHHPSEIKVEARDDLYNRFFLIRCIQDHTLWVDEEFINSALERRIVDLISLKRFEP